MMLKQHVSVHHELDEGHEERIIELEHDRIRPVFSSFVLFVPSFENREKKDLSLCSDDSRCRFERTRKTFPHVFYYCGRALAHQTLRGGILRINHQQRETLY
jgi:hypothetical protein